MGVPVNRKGSNNFLLKGRGSGVSLRFAGRKFAVHGSQFAVGSIANTVCFFYHKVTKERHKEHKGFTT